MTSKQTASKSHEELVRSLSESMKIQEDTSEIYNSLKHEYKKLGDTIEVDFRSLLPWVKLGDQLTHQIHPYPAKLIPQIANLFTRANVLSNSDRAVLDPFCGSGTVALEASIAGCKPYVADANPLALLITKVKTTPYDTKILREELEQIVSKSRRYRKAPQISVVNSSIWYTIERKTKLEIILRAISEVNNPDIRDFFRVCFSVVAKRLSNADPAISVPVRLKTREIFTEQINKKILEKLSWIEKTSPVDEFLRISLNNIERVHITNSLYTKRQKSSVVGNDAREIDFPKINGNDYQVPLIVTSPPYGSAQKYVRASSLSLNWLEFVEPKKLTSLEDKSIGREHAPKFRRNDTFHELPDTFEDLLVKVESKNELRAYITRQYLNDLRDSLLEMHRVTCKGGHIILVIGNNHVCSEPLRNDLFITEVMNSCGLNLELSLIDHIKSRGLMTKRNKTASLISREHVLVFSK